MHGSKKLDLNQNPLIIIYLMICTMTYMKTLNYNNKLSILRATTSQNKTLHLQAKLNPSNLQFWKSKLNCGIVVSNALEAGFGIVSADGLGLVGFRRL